MARIAILLTVLSLITVRVMDHAQVEKFYKFRKLKILIYFSQK